MEDLNQPEPASPIAARPRVLVVDDDDAVRMSLRWMLKESDYSVFDAADGVQALKHLEQQQTDVVVLDLLMPNKDGIETLGEIKRRWPAVKVISISGGSFYSHPEINLSMSLQLGAVCALEKPFSPEVFETAVNNALLG
ncbi:MAG TPA: response regulator [Verrucomicrobiae bacterium]|nr:response regulator [Verrucomicrobiae bacterium]